MILSGSSHVRMNEKMDDDSLIGCVVHEMKAIGAVARHGEHPSMTKSIIFLLFQNP